MPDSDESATTPPPKKAKVVRHKYGEYKNVLLSDEELDKLKTEFPTDWQNRIERLSAYMASTGKSYKSHLATIRNWARNDKSSKPAASTGGYGRPTKAQELSDFYGICAEFAGGG